MAGLANRNDLPLLRPAPCPTRCLPTSAGSPLDTVAGKRATFSRSNVFAEVLRQLHGVRFASADDRMSRSPKRTTTLALTQVLLISPPELPTPPRRSAATTEHPGSG